jgi:starch synthase (maltosyl-transferring)
VIEGVQPEIDCGRFAIKRVEGERVVVEADIFADRTDALGAAVAYRREKDPDWTEVPMEPLANDRWRGAFTVTELGRWRYTLLAWVDRFETWRRDLAVRVEADFDVRIELLLGAELVRKGVRRSPPDVGAELQQWARRLRAAAGAAEPADVARALALEAVQDERLAALMSAAGDRGTTVTYAHDLPVIVDRERARYSTWYEMFPRSASPQPGRHGTFRDVEARLPYVSGMGFDVLYLPPIHPIGHTNRKGPNNATSTGDGDPGSPWAIGSEEGGHTAVHPALGTLGDFDRLVAAAREHGMEVALDLALQCSPDHPWVREHPQWFRHLPDGSIRYAENPPKKYQDVYPMEFDTEAWQELWGEVAGVVRFWIGHGVRIFRVDNPHTKPFAFWEWLIEGIQADDPDVIFLSEAFTRPKVMYRLAKLGFSQSYTYFAWRNSAAELRQYFEELTQSPVREFFRPNLWLNTPDILTEILQTGGRPAFVARLILAATLGASYGIYGPAFELMEHVPREPGSEEYRDSEKYEIRTWDLDRPDSLKELIARVNRIRRENPALQSDRSLRFHRVGNPHLLAYSKREEDGSGVVLVAVNVDAATTQAGSIDLPPEDLGLPPRVPYVVHDLLTGARHQWKGARPHIELDPRVLPACIFRVEPASSRPAGSGVERLA